MVIAHSTSPVSLKRPWCAFHIMQRDTHSFISLISHSHTKDIDYFERMKRCATVSCNNLHLMLNTKINLRTCITHTQVINLAPLPEQHTPQIARRALLGSSPSLLFFFHFSLSLSLLLSTFCFLFSLFRSRSLSLFSFFMTNPEVVAEILEETGVLGWIIAALLEDGPNQEVVWSGFFFNSGVSQQILKCFF